MILLRAEDELSGADVLSGLRCKVAELFPKQPQPVDHGPFKSETAPQSPGS